jgi:hypothetical protein
LDPEVVRLHDLRKGDIVKAVLLGVLKGSRNEEESGENGE